MNNIQQHYKSKNKNIEYKLNIKNNINLGLTPPLKSTKQKSN